MILQVRLEELRQHRVQILAKPRLRLRPLQVAAGFIDLERRVPRHVVRDHGIEQLRQLFPIRLAPQPPGPAEPVALVHVVVRRRKVLHTARNRGIRNPVPVLNRSHLIANGVIGPRLFHANVLRHRQAQLVRLIERRVHRVPPCANDLEPIGPGLLDLLHPPPRRLRITHPAQHRIHKHVRRNDLARLALRPHVQGLRQRAAHISHRRNAARQPQLQHIVGVHRHAATLGMQVPVQIDQPRQNILALGINHHVARLRRGAPDGGDHAVFNGDVDRPRRRRAVALHHRRPANHHPLRLHAMSRLCRQNPKASKNQ